MHYYLYVLDDQLRWNDHNDEQFTKIFKGTTSLRKKLFVTKDTYVLVRMYSIMYVHHIVAVWHHGTTHTSLKY